MRIAREQSTRLWKLYAGSVVLYEGYRSPWESPKLMADALREARRLQQASEPRPH